MPVTFVLNLVILDNQRKFKVIQDDIFNQNETQKSFATKKVLHLIGFSCQTKEWNRAFLLTYVYSQEKKSMEYKRIKK